jgi:flagellar motor component MotA
MGFLGFIIMFVLAIVGLSASGSLGYVIDIPSLLIVIGISLGMLLMAYGSSLGSASKTIFRKSAEQKALMLSLAVFERGKSFAIASGVIGTMIGVVCILASLDDIAALGPGLATALITSIYSLALSYGVFQLIVISLKRRLKNADV